MVDGREILGGEKLDMSSNTVVAFADEGDKGPNRKELTHSSTLLREDSGAGILPYHCSKYDIVIRANSPQHLSSDISSHCNDEQCEPCKYAYNSQYRW